MRHSYVRPFRYSLTQAPRALRRAKLDNIAIVPASMLAGKERLQEKVNTLPRRQVFLYHTKENRKQKQVLERVKKIFRRLGYAVTLLPMEQVG
jgi:prephenate dehydrogenase